MEQNHILITYIKKHHMTCTGHHLKLLKTQYLQGFQAFLKK
nr:MAG TPA: hypothetical protein [Caudoviricetes sp.]